MNMIEFRLSVSQSGDEPWNSWDAKENSVCAKIRGEIDGMPTVSNTSRNQTHLPDCSEYFNSFTCYVKLRRMRTTIDLIN